MNTPNKSIVPVAITMGSALMISHIFYVAINEKAVAKLLLHPETGLALETVPVACLP